MSPELFVLFFFVALLYASAGFGGGSSYLAIMGLWGVEMHVMRTTSLLCNMVVVGGGSWLFWRSGYLNTRRIALLCVSSVPCAFAGGAVPLREKTFFILLGGSLVVAAFLMFFQGKQVLSDGPVDPAKAFDKYRRVRKPFVAGLTGGGIGFLSGMVGIGGGIFLSPLLHLLRWATPKEIAATASFFILVNSVAGLLGQWWQHRLQFDPSFALPLMVAVLAGGQAGSRLSALRLHQRQVRVVTALLILYAGISILWSQL